MSETIYTITKEHDSKRLQEAANKIYDQKEDLLGKQITWEGFTTEYMDFPAPNGDELIRQRWIAARTTWVKALNELFIENKQPFHLEVLHSHGVYLLTDKPAAFKKISKRCKRQVNLYRTTVDEMQKIKASKAFPEVNRAIQGFTNIVREGMYGFLGKIENTRTLPKGAKEEIKEIIRKALPPSDPLQLPFDED